MQKQWQNNGLNNKKQRIKEKTLWELQVNRQEIQRNDEKIENEQLKIKADSVKRKKKDGNKNA